MSMLGPFDRPLALHLGDTRRRAVPRWAVAPPIRRDRHEQRRSRPSLERARFLTTTLLGAGPPVDDVMSELDSTVGEFVVAWSPSMCTTTRTALVSELRERDDALADVDVTIVADCVSGSRAFVEWRLRCTFAKAAFLGDDILVEPSHGAVESAGVFVFVFVGDHVDQIDCYFDTLALLEQVLPPDHVDDPGD